MLNPGPVLETLGPWALVAIAVVLFIESGLLFPFLPGDSLLVSAGLLHERLGLTVAVIALVGFVAAVAGNLVGYFIGQRFGTRLFKDHAKVLTTARLHDTEGFFDRYGGRAVVLARFVPVLRTYVPLAAGAARYPFRRFLVWNAVGALLWAVGVTILGSLLSGVPFIADNLEVILAAVVIVSVLPLLIDHFRKRAKRRREEQRAVAE
ncbi:VTT domain-containing protein [Amnibacterium sp.]|uniref:DedA family protein n=1 Tax=Amnibacterium sp. TaxID=1872496 RepID=UPI0026239323|nr:VTT domain-containing protein [Amnibacterium sp.]MCU1473534.1 alkaline phosphatase [Amnibacterium sp.]